MKDETLNDYMELIATFQERYDHEDALELMDVVTAIYGYNEETLDNLNYYLTGYNDYSQLKELENEYKD